MSDPTPTRVETVTANIEAAEAKWGEYDWQKIMITTLKDISMSLAMLVDNSGS